MIFEPALLELLAWSAILGLFFSFPWRRVATVGLPLCYILSLSMIHWMGGLIHILPTRWRSGPDPFSLVGFEQAFWGILAFATGTFVLAPLILKMFAQGEVGPAGMRATPYQLRLPYIYIGLGILFFGVLAPALRAVPSIYAASVSGIYLVVVGLCLACWSAFIRRNYLELVAWLFAVCLIPLVTIVTIGFVGYGAGASLLVLTFVVTLYRPQWQALIGFGLIGFLGLSLFITYFRDRPEIRAKVWGGADYADRIDTFATTLGKFEFIDFQNPRHLQAIDDRLNQNYLVGRVVRTIELGQEEFAYGGTVYDGLLALVPRILWPEKPVTAGSWGVVSRYARVYVDPSTSVGIGHVMEFYINFGTPGVIVGFLILGIVIRIVDVMAAFQLHRGNWQGFMSWFLPTMALLNVGGSLVELFGTMAASTVLVFIVNKILTATQPTAASAAGSVPAAHFPNN